MDYRLITGLLPMNILQYERHITNAQEISPVGRDDDLDRTQIYEMEVGGNKYLLCYIAKWMLCA